MEQPRVTSARERVKCNRRVSMTSSLCLLCARSEAKSARSLCLATWSDQIFFYTFHMSIPSFCFSNSLGTILCGEIDCRPTSTMVSNTTRALCSTVNWVLFDYVAVTPKHEVALTSKSATGTTEIIIDLCEHHMFRATPQTLLWVHNRYADHRCPRCSCVRSMKSFWEIDMHSTSFCFESAGLDMLEIVKI